jgi:hypothetical protein
MNLEKILRAAGFILYAKSSVQKWYCYHVGTRKLSINAEHSHAELCLTGKTMDTGTDFKLPCLTLSATRIVMIRSHADWEIRQTDSAKAYIWLFSERQKVSWRIFIIQ